MFTLFRVRNQTVECYIDHYYGHPAIASPAPRGAASLAYRVHPAHCNAARSISPRRVHLAGPTTPATIHHIPNHARNQRFFWVFSPDAIEYNYA